MPGSLFPSPLALLAPSGLFPSPLALLAPSGRVLSGPMTPANHTLSRSQFPIFTARSRPEPYVALTARRG
jgi:hypothetical protein